MSSTPQKENPDAVTPGPSTQSSEQFSKSLTGRDRATVSALVQALRPLTDRVRQDVTAVKVADGSSRWTNDPLTPERINAHVAGTSVRGVTQIAAGESTTRVAVLDFDSHKGETSWDEMLRVAGDVADSLRLYGLEPIAWRSSGGRGVHLYMLWEAPQDAYSVRMLLRDALATCGLQDGAKGVANGQVEVFPRQDEVAHGGYGNQVILPLAGQSVPLDLDLGMALDRPAALRVDWVFSMPVDVRDRPVKVVAENQGAEPLAKVQSALAAVPCTDFDYHGWHRMVCAVHEATGGTDEALEVVLKWSEDYPDHDEKLVRQRIWPYIKSERSNGVTRATLFAEAAKRDWSMAPAPSAEGFTDVLPAVIEPEESLRELPPFVRDKKGAILATIGNVLHAVRRPDVCGRQIAYDSFRDELMVSTGGAMAWRPFTDADYTHMREYLERNGFDSIGKELIRDAVHAAAQEAKFDSAQLWLSSLEWDGVPRIEQFLQGYAGVEDTPYARAVSLYLWTALAGRVMAPGCQADMVPILVGPQGMLKSSLVRAMVPSEDHFCSVNLAQRDDDLSRKMRGRLIAEMGELRGFRAKEIEAVKEFITSRHEVWTPKFKEFATNFPRRLIFVGTTNREQFLADDTGNRRWLPVRVEQPCKPENAARDHELLWAEGRTLFASGGVAWRDAERLANEVLDEFAETDPWLEPARRWLDGTDFDGKAIRARPCLTTDDLLTGLHVDPKARGREAEMHAGVVLRALGYERKQIRVDGRREWVYVRPESPPVTTESPPDHGEVVTADPL